MTIITPIKTNLRPVNSYLNYLWKGVERLNITLCLDASLPEAREALIGLDICVVGKKIRCWWDWSDFREMQLVGEVPYGKIELRGKDSVEGLFATAQITPEALEDNLNTIQCVGKFDRDVYCVCRETNYADRLRCVEVIKSLSGVSVLAGLSSRHERPIIPEHAFIERDTPEVYYKNLVTSKLCIAPMGIGEKTYRHMEILAVGSCLVMPETDCVWPSDYQDCVVLVKRDWSDLPDKIEYYLTHEKERLEIARRGREYWKNWLSPEGFVRTLLRGVGVPL